MKNANLLAFVKIFVTKNDIKHCHPSKKGYRKVQSFTYIIFIFLLGCGLEVKVSSIDGMVQAAESSEEMKNYVNNSGGGGGTYFNPRCDR